MGSGKKKIFKITRDNGKFYAVSMHGGITLRAEFAYLDTAIQWAYSVAK